MKLFASIGVVLDAVTTVTTNTAKVAITLTNSANTLVERSDTLLNHVFDAVEIPTTNMLEDLRCDSITDNAERDIRIAEAEAKAKAIRASLAPKRRVAKVTTKAKAK